VNNPAHRPSFLFFNSPSFLCLNLNNRDRDETAGREKKPNAISPVILMTAALPPHVLAAVSGSAFTPAPAEPCLFVFLCFCLFASVVRELRNRIRGPAVSRQTAPRPAPRGAVEALPRLQRDAAGLLSTASRTPSNPATPGETRCVKF
jgi:hypothetical protein